MRNDWTPAKTRKKNEKFPLTVEKKPTKRTNPGGPKPLPERAEFWKSSSGGGPYWVKRRLGRILSGFSTEWAETLLFVDSNSVYHKSLLTTSLLSSVFLEIWGKSSRARSRNWVQLEKEDFAKVFSRIDLRRSSRAVLPFVVGDSAMNAHCNSWSTHL